MTPNGRACASSFATSTFFQSWFRCLIQLVERDTQLGALRSARRRCAAGAPQQAQPIAPPSLLDQVQRLSAKAGPICSAGNAYSGLIHRPLEAKIVDVTLSSSFQSGINWAAFHSGGASFGQVSPGTVLQPRGANALQATGATIVTNADGTRSAIAPTASAFPGRDLVNHSIAGGNVFGLALATSNFAALLTFLETQGNVQVLSSPRLATLNNQKAVLKVGTDEFFVTGVSTTSTTTGSATQTTPSITVQPFFSGIVLDVTPQIDEDGNIILHIHPSVSEVTESTRIVNFGGVLDQVRLPLAKSTVNETDTIVRVSDGNIVAIGGLMSVDVRDNRGGLPGVTEGGIGDLVRNTDRRTGKRELVILIKPTVIQSDRESEEDLRQMRQRYEALTPPAGRR